MQTVEPFNCTVEPGAVVIRSVPGLRHYNPIGSVHGGYAAILLDSAMGLAVQSTLPVGTGSICRDRPMVRQNAGSPAARRWRAIRVERYRWMSWSRLIDVPNSVELKQC
jgi:hypothetical protein